MGPKVREEVDKFDCPVLTAIVLRRRALQLLPAHRVHAVLRLRQHRRADREGGAQLRAGRGCGWDRVGEAIRYHGVLPRRFFSDPVAYADGLRSRLTVQFAAPAEHYDRFMGRYLPTLAPALIDAAGVPSDSRVVDVGCGTGGLATELAAHVGGANVAAIDPAPRFVAACRERVPEGDIREGVAEELPWSDDEFDVALSSLVVAFMSDPDQGLREMARVTRPGGTVAACMWDIAGGGMTMLKTFWTAAREVDPSVEGERKLAGIAGGRHRRAARTGRVSRTSKRARSRPAPTTRASTTSGNRSPTLWGRRASTSPRATRISRRRSAKPAERSCPRVPSRWTRAPGSPAESCRGLVAYDERLADRVRELVGGREGFSERKMFGGIAFMLHGNMCCGVMEEELIVRLGDEAGPAALAEPHVREFDFTGRPMKSTVLVEPAGDRFR